MSKSKSSPKADFKTLQDKWYKKLQKSGFEDIESRDGRLNRYSSSYLKQRSAVNPDEYATKEKYYQLAGQFLNDYEFNNRLERFIWEQHCEGVSIRDIVKDINKKGNKIYRRLVHEMLQKLTSEMLTKTKDKK